MMANFFFIITFAKMRIEMYFLFLSFLFFPSSACFTADTNNVQPSIKVGAERIHAYLPRVSSKKVGLVVNNTSRVGNTHLLDTLLSLGVKVEKVFAPEHGFRGEADAGATIKDGRDESTGLPLVSLYGAKKKPGPEDLRGLEMIIFDIQDVGVRFYTYISTLHYVMEACAEQGIPLLVLDRPNPNGHYIDGPVLDPAFSSFVGMHSVPVVHGMTIGEYALMTKGENWINQADQLDLEVITCEQYYHQLLYDLPVRPSPNLPNLRSILLYPSLCFFEGTDISVGRGTDLQFQIIGHPSLKSKFDFSFTPASKPGAKSPPHLGKTCYGISYADSEVEALFQQKRLDLSPLIVMFAAMSVDKDFFLKNLFFDKLAGTDQLRKALLAGKDEAWIRAQWQADLLKYDKMRQAYLLYPL